MNRLSSAQLLLASQLLLACPSSNGSKNASVDGAPPAASLDSGSPPARALVHTELPGMSIDLPSYAPVRGDFAAGSVQGESPVEYSVIWRRGSVPPPEALGNIVSGMSAALEKKLRSKTRVEGPRGITTTNGTVQQYEVSSENAFTALATFFDCGGRVVHVIVGGHPVEVRPVNDRVIASFRCTAEAGAPAGAGAVLLDAPAGWHPASPGSTMLANARHVLVRPDAIADTTKLPLPEVVSLGAVDPHFHIDPESARVRDGRTVFTATMDSPKGGRSPAAIVAWRCPRHVIGMVYVMSAAGAPIDDGVALALKARCRDPSE